MKRATRSFLFDAPTVKQPGPRGEHVAPGASDRVKQFQQRRKFNFLTQAFREAR